MVAPSPAKLYTVEDLDGLPDDGTQYELHEGKLIAMPPSQRNSTEIAVEFVRVLANFVRGKKVGYVSGADGGYILARNPDIVFAPDAGFIIRDRAGGRDEGYFQAAPDLAVEVISPSDRASAVRKKLEQYFEHGTRLVWVVYPDTRTIDVHTKDGSRRLSVEHTLDGGEVLPGFSASVTDIFSILDE